MPNLDWNFYATWINLLLMKHKLINFGWINLIVHNLLINFYNRENKFGIQKNISETKKKMKLRKKVQNRKKKLKPIKIFRDWEKKFRIEKNISETCFKIGKCFVTRIEKKYLELNIFTTFLHISFIACILFVTVKWCFAQNVTLKLEKNIPSFLHVSIKQGLN